MNLRSAATKKLEVTVIVVFSSGLAILSADHFQRSGPDRELLRQLKEMQQAQQACEEREDVCHSAPHRWNGPPPGALHRYAER
jgi:hypothetical protein